MQSSGIQKEHGEVDTEDVVEPLVRGCASSDARSAPAASGYARKNPPPARVLTLTASARVIRTPAHHRLDVRVSRTAVAKRCLSGWDACGGFFELTVRAARIASWANLAPLRTR
jgi:hypothetical protein